MSIVVAAAPRFKKSINSMWLVHQDEEEVRKHTSYSN